MPARVEERSGFLRARVLVSPALEEQAVAALWDSGCLGVQVIAAGRQGRLRLDAYYPGKAGKGRLEARLAEALHRTGLKRQPKARLARVSAGRWVERWQRSLRPMTVGRFQILPEGCRSPAARGGRIPIRVRFGQAFGTGEHASTQLCLRLLARHLGPPGGRVADLGTGSGILAIAALRLGAGRVTALDDDGVALSVARANLRDNGLRGSIRLVRADAASARQHGPFDLVLVNIGAATIARMLPDLGAMLCRGGRAILAGILVDDETALLSAARSAGLRLIDRRRSSPWSALVLRRIV
jgi:ribosomal protein L11 methyltransferase